MTENIVSLLVFLFIAGLPLSASADLVSVRYAEGLSHGFLVVRQDGTQIAEGESTQVVRGDRVKSHLVFHFTDGSVYDDTTVFTQQGTFRLLSDHTVERGPTFKVQMDCSIDAVTGKVTVRYKKGYKEDAIVETLKLPDDVANGMVFTLAKDWDDSTPITLSYVSTTPKPRLVKLIINRGPDDPFMTGRVVRHAKHYVMKVQIGGVAGVVAPILGKQPPETQIWILDGEAPTFVGSEGPLYGDGPVWRIETISPTQLRTKENRAK